MTKKEKETLQKEIDQFHQETEDWLMQWFRPAADAVKPELQKRFDNLRKNLNL